MPYFKDSLLLYDNFHHIFTFLSHSFLIRLLLEFLLTFRYIFELMFIQTKTPILICLGHWSLFLIFKHIFSNLFQKNSKKHFQYIKSIIAISTTEFYTSRWCESYLYICFTFFSISYTTVNASIPANIKLHKLKKWLRTHTSMIFTSICSCKLSRLVLENLISLVPPFYIKYCAYHSIMDETEDLYIVERILARRKNKTG